MQSVHKQHPKGESDHARPNDRCWRLSPTEIRRSQYDHSDSKQFRGEIRV